MDIESMDIVKINITGHRPNKIGWGYNYNEEHWIKLKNELKNIIKNTNASIAYTGMALGVDTVFALAILELKAEGHDIKLRAALPCTNQCWRWEKSSQDLYYNILSQADEIIGASEENTEGYERLKLFSVKNNVTGNYDILLLKKDMVENIDFSNTPLDKSMIYSQLYRPYLMQKRNEYMVDNSDICIAVWNGTNGGTGNCVRYAKKKGRNIIVIDPKDYKDEVY